MIKTLSKLLFPVFILTLITTGVSSQTIYEDVIFLKKYVDSSYKIGPDNYFTPEEKNIEKGMSKPNSKGTDSIITSRLQEIRKLKLDSIFDLFLRYKLVDSSNVKSSGQSTADIRKNPFFKSFVVSGQPRSASQLSAVNYSPPTGNGPVVTQLADGFARFLIKRGKEELMIAVISKLKDERKFPEIKLLFPETHNLLNTFDAWDYKNIVNTLKEAFNKDLQALLTNLCNLNTTNLQGKYDPKAAKRIDTLRSFIVSDDGRIFLSALQLGNGLMTGQKIPDIVHTIASDDYLGGLQAPPILTVKHTIRFLDILSYSVRSDEPDENYISAEEFKGKMDNSAARKIFFGLLYQQIKNSNNPYVNVILRDLGIPGNEIKYEQYILSLIRQGQTIKNATDKLRDARDNGEKDVFRYYGEIFRSGQDLLRSTQQLSAIHPSLKFSGKMEKILNYSRQTLDIAQNISVQNYSAMIVTTLGLISKIDSTGVSKPFQEVFVKYGSFAANIVQSKDADDAEAAFEALALPVGSYSIKQKSAWNLSVNAYVGYGIDLNYAHGVYAPLGLSSSWALGNKGGAITLFASVADVGSLVSYRLTNGNTDTLKQEIRLESIFSPSVQVFYAIPGLPVAVGAGWKRSPKLFYKKNTFELAERSRSVFNISVLLDIPIITLNNRPRN